MAEALVIRPSGPRGRAGVGLALAFVLAFGISLGMSIARPTSRGAGVTVVPCSKCVTPCVCPRLSGEVRCGCPR